MWPRRRTWASAGLAFPEKIRSLESWFPPVPRVCGGTSNPGDILSLRIGMTGGDPFPNSSGSIIPHRCIQKDGKEKKLIKSRFHFILTRKKYLMEHNRLNEEPEEEEARINQRARGEWGRVEAAAKGLGANSKVDRGGGRWWAEKEGGGDHHGGHNRVGRSTARSVLRVHDRPVVVERTGAIVKFEGWKLRVCGEAYLNIQTL